MSFIPKAAAPVILLFLASGDDKVKCWSYRNDIGSHWGIKGYEE